MHPAATDIRAASSGVAVVAPPFRANSTNSDTIKRIGPAVPCHPRRGVIGVLNLIGEDPVAVLALVLVRRSASPGGHPRFFQPALGADDGIVPARIGCEVALQVGADDAAVDLHNHHRMVTRRSCCH